MNEQAWHFCGLTLRDGSPRAKVGEWETYEGEVVMCQSGLHASARLIDALDYAPGPILRLVEVEDVVDRENDKLVCRRRKVLAEIDATEILREFARGCALQVSHLWDAPDVVVEYLRTGDESLRAAAWTAAGDAAWAAARTAVRAAAKAAAKAAVRDAVWAAVWAAARTAAWTAAGDAAMDKQNAELERMVLEAMRAQGGGSDE